ncbi:MAG: hemerythrin domain-containing protein, partial [Ignavibacteriaceae bacterium]|nr:hemerythrin domain-containing protein [Ignavibacteriaceae bacterium]
MADTGPTAVMKMEHREIKNYLNEIFTYLKNGNTQTDELEEGLLEVLSEHNLKEENILYPMIDNAVDDKELEDVFFRIKDLSPKN